MLTNGRLAEVITTVPVVRSLSIDDLELLQRDAMPFALRRDEALPLSETGPQGFALVTSGCLSVCRAGDQGKRILLYRVRAGEGCTLSAVALLRNAPRDAQVCAESPTTGVLLPRALLAALMERSGPFRDFVLGLHAERFVQLVDLVGQLAFGTLDRRLAATLLTRPYPITVTHRELADELGSAREMISRILKSFESREMVKLGRGSIYVVNEEALRGVARGATNGSGESNAVVQPS